MIWRNLGLIFLFLLACFILTRIWLRIYTHHGQSMELPDFVGQDIQTATQLAKQRSFQIRVIDSVFIVNKEGGIILDQNPEGGAQVKRKRKIYVTITKKQADLIPLRRLPVLYGKSYDRKRKELKQGFEINTSMGSKAYDPGPPDHILAVIYKGDTVVNAQMRKNNVLIEKGGTLSMVVSKNTGGRFQLPDVTCKSYLEALFQLETLNLFIDKPVLDEDIRRIDEAFVYRQSPDASTRITMGDTINLYLSKELPPGCNE